MTVSLQDMVRNLTESGLLSTRELDTFMQSLPEEEKPVNALMMAEVLTRYGKLTQYQATAAYEGNVRGLILGDYVIVNQLGKGGMGQVFRAKHRRMNRMVALKILAPASAVSETAIRRFHREVELAAKLSHPHIVTAYDANEHHGVHYLVMELVDGDNLSALVKREGPFPIERALDAILQGARGLAYAHAQGIVHRDIKPSNLLMDKSGMVKVLDLGLARLDINDLSADEEGEGLTQTNQVLGTVDFMAPEQSLNAREADHRADIYSLGCTLYRLLTGKNVYVGGTVIEKIVAHREHPIPSLLALRPEAPPELDQLLQRMLAKNPDDRVGTMTEVIRELERILGIPPQADPLRSSGSLPKPSEIVHDAETPSESRTGLDREDSLRASRPKIEVPKKPESKKKSESDAASRAGSTKPESDTESKSQSQKSQAAKAAEEAKKKEEEAKQKQEEAKKQEEAAKKEAEAKKTEEEKEDERRAEEALKRIEARKKEKSLEELRQENKEDSGSATASPSATIGATKISRADLVRPDDTVAVAIKEMKTRPWLVLLLLLLISITSLPILIVLVLPGPRAQVVTVVGAAALGGFDLLEAPPLVTAARDTQYSLTVTGLPPAIAATAPATQGALPVGATQDALGKLLTAGLPGGAPEGKPLQLSVLWVAGHGVAQQGAAELICRDFHAAGQGGRYPLAKLIEEFKTVQAGAKLLLIDAGSIVQDPRLGLPVNEFPRLAMQAVQAANDPQLWVLVSHSPLEQSHTSKELRQTLFAYFTAQGLAGAADLNQDRKIDLEEFTRYLSANIGGYVQQTTGGRESQTPMLVWGGGAQPPEGEGTLADLAKKTVVTLIYEGSRAKAPPAFGPSAPRTRLQAAVAEGWKLRDAFDARQEPSQESFIDYASPLWREYQATLLAAERLARNDSDLGDERATAIAADLERTNARLADIAADRKPSATLAEGQLGERLTAARPQVITGLNEVRSFALFDRIAWAPGAASVHEIESLEKQFDERLKGTEKDLYAWATGPAAKYDPLVELRLTSRLAKRSMRLPIDLVKTVLAARRDAENAAAWALHYGIQPGGEGWAPFWLAEPMQQADQIMIEAERSLLYESGELADKHLEPLREAQRLYSDVLTDVSRVKQSIRIRNDLLFRMPYYIAWHGAAGAKADDAARSAIMAPTAAEIRKLLGHLKAMAQLQLSPPSNLPVQFEAEANAAAELSKKLHQAFADDQLAAIEAAVAEPTAAARIRVLLATPLPPAPARARLLAALEKTKFAFTAPEAPAELALPGAMSAANWQQLFANLELEHGWVELSATLTGQPHVLSKEWGELNSAFQQFSQSATPELEAAFWTACRAFGAARQAWQAGLPAQLLAEQDAGAPEAAKGPGPRFAALESVDLRTRWIDPRDAKVASGLHPAELLRRLQLQCLFYWHAQRFQAGATATEARQADQNYLKEAARIYNRQGDLLKSSK